MGDKRTVVVTGALGGIGAACVEAFLARGCRVAAVDKEGRDDKQPLSKIHPSTDFGFFQADISDEGACEKIRREIAEKFGGADILVNNAGIIKRSSTEGTALDDWNRVLAVNLTGTFLMTKAFLPLLRASGGGRIINISSRAAGRPHKNSSPSYGATKAALVYMTRHWAVEFADDGLLCFAVSPGPVKTPMFDALDPSYKTRITDEMAIKRPIAPEEVANIVVYAALDCPAAMTGQTFHCNGGSFWP
jgi:3-oxoacyl-[acyl-carrier protein] reductase